MPYVLGRMKVEDYAKWKSGFSNPDSSAFRKASGAKSYHIFCTEDDPNHLVVLLEWDDLDNARKYYESLFSNPYKCSVYQIILCTLE